MGDSRHCQAPAPAPVQGLPCCKPRATPGGGGGGGLRIAAGRRAGVPCRQAPGMRWRCVMLADPGGARTWPRRGAVGRAAPPRPTFSPAVAAFELSMAKRLLVEGPTGRGGDGNAPAQRPPSMWENLGPCTADVHMMQAPPGASPRGTAPRTPQTCGLRAGGGAGRNAPESGVLRRRQPPCARPPCIPRARPSACPFSPACAANCHATSMGARLITGQAQRGGDARRWAACERPSCQRWRHRVTSLVTLLLLLVPIHPLALLVPHPLALLALRVLLALLLLCRSRLLGRRCLRVEGRGCTG